MKKSLQFPILAFFVFLSCNKPENTASESFEEIENSMAIEVEDEPVPVLVMTFPVESFSKWKAAFENDKESRESRDIRDLGDLVFYEDPRHVSVFMRVPSHEKSEEYANSEELKQSLKAMGVIGEPNITLVNALKLPEKPILQKYRLMITHEVKDYNHWKEVFDQHEPERRDAGLELIGIGTSTQNESRVSVMFAFDDMDTARIFAASDELKEAMKESGVISDPILAWYENLADN